MQISRFIISVFLIFIVFAAFGGLFVDLKGTDKYNVNVSRTFEGAYTEIDTLADFVDNTSTVAYNISDESREAKQLEGDLESPEKSQIRATKISWSAVKIVSNVVVKAADYLKIPPILVSVLTIVIVILMTFAVISLIFKWKT